MPASRAENVTLQSLYRSYIAGCHILHYHGVIDAYGHLSFRHPDRPDVFVMSRYIAPGTISSPADLIEYRVADSEPVDPRAPKGYSERCIHSECYRKYPDVHSVLHSHSEEVVPYTINAVPLRPCYHMSAFLSDPVPVFEISDVYLPEEKHDMLVRNTHLGGALASRFSNSPDAAESALDHCVVLMRGHGMTVVAPSIEDCVLRGVYTQKNALVQTRALTGCAAAGGNAASIRYLSAEEAKAATVMTLNSAMRPWRLWLREVDAAGMYVNLA